MIWCFKQKNKSLGLTLVVFLSGFGPAASDSEDRFAGADNSQTRWHTGAVYHAEPYRDYHLNYAHPEHSSASPGKQLAIFIPRVYVTVWLFLMIVFGSKRWQPPQSNELLLVSVPRH